MIRLFKHYIPHAVILVGVLDLLLLYLAGDLSWRLRAKLAWIRAILAIGSGNWPVTLA